MNMWRGGNERGTASARTPGHRDCAVRGGPLTGSMPQDLHTARRAEHMVARCTTCLLFACLLLEAGTFASSLSHRSEPAPVAASTSLAPGEATGQNAQPRAMTQLKRAALIATAIVWLTWLHWAYGNLGLVGSKRSRFTRGWARGYWFIPLVNLVRAYQVMKDLWLRSDSLNDRDAYDRLPAPAYLTGWWGLSVTRAVLGVPITLMARDARTHIELINATDLGMLVNAVGVIAGVLAIKVVREIDRRQQCFELSPTQQPAAVPQRRAGASA